MATFRLDSAGQDHLLSRLSFHRDWRAGDLDINLVSLRLLRLQVVVVLVVVLGLGQGAGPGAAEQEEESHQELHHDRRGHVQLSGGHWTED